MSFSALFFGFRGVRGHDAKDTRHQRGHLPRVGFIRVAEFQTRMSTSTFFEGGLSGLAGKGVPIQTRGPTDANNIHITGWYRNATNVSPRSYGFAFNANYMVGERFMWFLRGRWSKDFIANGAMSGWFGWRPPKERSDLTRRSQARWGEGAGAGRGEHNFAGRMRAP